MTFRSRALLLGSAAAVTAVFFINFCDLVFRCGCRSLWNGADVACNIHHAAGPHCPWCAIGTAGGVAVFAFIAASHAFVVFSLPRILPVPRIALTFAAFPLTGGVLALILGLVQGYWQ